MSWMVRLKIAAYLDQRGIPVLSDLLDLAGITRFWSEEPEHPAYLQVRYGFIGRSGMHGSRSYRHRYALKLMRWSGCSQSYCCRGAGPFETHVVALQAVKVLQYLYPELEFRDQVLQESDRD